MVGLLAVIGATLGALLGTGAFSSPNSELTLDLNAPVVVPVDPDNSSRLVSPQGDVTIEVEGGSVEKNLGLRYRALTTPETPPLPTGFVPVGKHFDLSITTSGDSEPITYKLLKPLTITIKLNTADVALARAVETNVVIQHHQDGQWTSLPTTVDWASASARAHTDSLSLFAMTIRIEEDARLTAAQVEQMIAAASAAPESNAEDIRTLVEQAVAQSVGNSMTQEEIEAVVTGIVQSAAVVEPLSTPVPTLFISPTAPPSPVVEPTISPVPTATVVPTPNPTIAPTAIPTATPRPTHTPTPVPTATITPTPNATPIPPTRTAQPEVVNESSEAVELRPVGISVSPTGRVYVADTSNDRVSLFDTGRLISQWGSRGVGEGEFREPTGVVADESGFVYVLDGGNRRVQKFNSSGTVFLGEWRTQEDGDDQLNRPEGIAATKSGGRVYVADTGNDRILVFISGRLISQWGTRGVGEGEFREPTGVVADESGFVYVLDGGNRRVQKFNSSGTVFLGEWSIDP